MIDQGLAPSASARQRAVTAYARGAWLGVVTLLMHFYLSGAVLMLADGVFWQRIRPPLQLVLYVASLLVVGMVEIVITHLSGQPQPVMERTALFGLGVISIAALIGSDRTVDHRRLLLAIAFAILAANLATWLIGIQGQSVYLQGFAPETLMFKGFRRVQFFFARGINSYGTIAGLFLALGLSDVLSTRSWFSFSVTVMAALSTILTDSRGALLAAILTVLVSYSTRSRALPRAVVLGSLFALPLILISGHLLDTVFAFAIRTDSLDLTTGRTAYWSLMISRLPQYVNNWWLGFGLMGPARLDIPLSNLSDFTLYLRQSDALPHAHNLWLQVFLEGGILKLLVILGLFMAIADAAGSIEDKSVRRLVLCSLYVPISGVSESSFDYLRIENLIFIFVLAGVAFTQTERTKRAAKYLPIRRSFLKYRATWH